MLVSWRSVGFPSMGGMAQPAQSGVFYTADLVRSITSHTASAWYFEITPTVAADITKIAVGIDNNAESLTQEAGQAGAIAWLGDGSINYNGVIGAYSFSPYLVNDVLGANPDLGAKTIVFRIIRGGSVIATSSAFSISAIVTGSPMYALAQTESPGDSVTANFTGTFAATAPATAWG